MCYSQLFNIFLDRDSCEQVFMHDKLGQTFFSGVFGILIPFMIFRLGAVESQYYLDSIVTTIGGGGGGRGIGLVFVMLLICGVRSMCSPFTFFSGNAHSSRSNGILTNFHYSRPPFIEHIFAVWSRRSHFPSMISSAAIYRNLSYWCGFGYFL